MKNIYGVGVLALAMGMPAFAGTVAYWRFENGPADAQMIHQSGTDGVWSADVPDSSGNGNALAVWTGGSWGGFAYKSSVSGPTVPQTGAANNFSVQNSGGYPGMWNNTLATWSPSRFTVEASFKPETGGYRTLVGRDSLGAGTQAGADPSAAALYLSIQPDNSVVIRFQDVMGYQYAAASAAGLIQGFDYPTDPTGLAGKWYSLAGVSDGTTLSLYLDDMAAGTGYQLVAQVLENQGSTNTALTPGVGGSGDWSAGNFSVGRGLYNGGHGDRAYGYIDEVRLSDTALAPSSFLMTAVPEPGTMLVMLVGVAGVALRRRRPK